MAAGREWAPARTAATPMCTESCTKPGRWRRNGKGCKFSDPDHSWQGSAAQYANGQCSGFLKTAPSGDRFPIGYYRREDLPILAALATGYTTFDNYFCAMQGPTWENRLYQLSGTTQVDMPDGFPKTRCGPSLRHLDHDLRSGSRGRTAHRLLPPWRADDGTFQKQEIRRHHPFDRSVLGGCASRYAAPCRVRRSRITRMPRRTTEPRMTITPRAACWWPSNSWRGCTMR